MTRIDGRRLFKERTKKGWTQERLSAESRKSVWSISNFENLRRDDAKQGTIEALARALGIEVKQLIPGDYSMRQCADDFVYWDAQFKDGPLTVSTIALDLTTGWENAKYSMNAATSKNIWIELLVLTNSAKVEGDPLFQVSSTLADVQIQKVLDDINGWALEEKTISITIKQYSKVLPLHGLRCRKQNSARWWITKPADCTGPLPRREWGEGCYQIFADPKAASVLEFETVFHHLWQDSPVFFEKRCLPSGIPMAGAND
ncbi:helix-turn-helix transcriptional regulator [bacterium]|nr:helix-turn-helix transcriptional regulator [bacterium]